MVMVVETVVVVVVTMVMETVVVVVGVIEGPPRFLIGVHHQMLAPQWHV